MVSGLNGFGKFWLSLKLFTNPLLLEMLVGIDNGKNKTVFVFALGTTSVSVHRLTYISAGFENPLATITGEKVKFISYLATEPVDE